MSGKGGVANAVEKSTPTRGDRINLKPRCKMVVQDVTAFLSKPVEKVEEEKL